MRYIFRDKITKTEFEARLRERVGNFEVDRISEAEEGRIIALYLYYGNPDRTHHGTWSKGHGCIFDWSEIGEVATS